MVPERQKGHVYYRCKRRDCDTKTVREELLDNAIRVELAELELAANALVQVANAEPPSDIATLDEQRVALELQIKDETRRLDRLEDFLLDGALDTEVFARKKGKIHIRLKGLQEKLAELPDPVALAAQHEQLAELRKSLVFLYENANRAEKRQIIENVWPNRTVCGKKPAFDPYSWVRRTDCDPALLGGAHERDTGRSSQGIDQGDRMLIQPLFEMLDRLGGHSVQRNRR